MSSGAYPQVYVAMTTGTVELTSSHPRQRTPWAERFRPSQDIFEEQPLFDRTGSFTSTVERVREISPRVPAQ